MNHALSSHVIANHRLTTAWLDRVHQSGIPAVEIFAARQHLDYRNRAQVAELGHWFKDSDLVFHALHSPMFSDDVWGRSGPNSVISFLETSKPRRQASVDEIKRAIEIAETAPFRFLIQHLGVGGEEFDERKIDAAFTALEELSLFARHRGVEILLENIPNGFSSAERLKWFLEVTHLDLNYCFDVGHANLGEGVEKAFDIMRDRIRSTHVHDNDGKKDSHIFPLLGRGGAVDWNTAMRLLRRGADRFPLLLELKEDEAFPQPVVAAQEIFEKLEAIRDEE